MTASFRFSKTPQIEPFLAFLMNFCPLKMLDLIKEFWHFLTIFDLFKVTYLVALFDCKLQVFKNLSKFTIFGIFNELLSTQNVDFARNVEWDFFLWFSNTVKWYHFLAQLSHVLKHAIKKNYEGQEDFANLAGLRKRAVEA